MMRYPCRQRLPAFPMSSRAGSIATNKIGGQRTRVRPQSYPLLEHFPPLDKPVEFVERLFIAVPGHFFTDFAHFSR